MTFSSTVAENLLVKAHRHCCLCHKPAGTKMEIHHMVPRSQGGDDTEDNGIPLCFDCHAEAETYNPNHPRGRRLTPAELKRHRDQWFEIVSASHWERSIVASAPEEKPEKSVEQILEVLGVGELWNPDNFDPISRSVQRLTREQCKALVNGLRSTLDLPDEDARWDAARVLEFLNEWEPELVPPDLVEVLAEDQHFAVRSCASVIYCEQALAAPDSVSLATLWRLARGSEDWYVQTPATSALRLVARARPLAATMLAEGTREGETEDQYRFAIALRELLKEHPSAARLDIAEILLAHGNANIREVGRAWRACVDERRKAGLSSDTGIF